MISLWPGLKIGFQGLAPESVFRVIRYRLIGLWCSQGTPRLFVSLRIAEKES
jgi:hypothetical protein